MTLIQEKANEITWSLTRFSSLPFFLVFHLSCDVTSDTDKEIFDQRSMIIELKEKKNKLI